MRQFFFVCICQNNAYVNGNMYMYAAEDAGSSAEKENAVILAES